MTRLNALPSLNLLITFLNIVISSKSSFFLAFNFNINVSTSKWLSYVNVYFTIDYVAWLIKWELSLNLDLSFWEITSCITKKEFQNFHCVSLIN
jgi:hypothetical protein